MNNNLSNLNSIRMAQELNRYTIMMRSLNLKQKDLDEEYKKNCQIIKEKQESILKSVAELYREEESTRIELAAFDYSNMKPSDFITLNLEKLEYIMYKKYGYGNYPMRYYYDNETNMIGRLGDSQKYFNLLYYSFGNNNFNSIINQGARTTYQANTFNPDGSIGAATFY